MLVLGHAKRIGAAAPSITVPPFHTGHLGFVPGTPVRINLVAPPLNGRHHELMVTPFEVDIRDLAVVTVGMRDQAGVVAELIDAVSDLGINIEVEESSSINLLDNHSVSLLVNLSATECSRSGASSLMPPLSPPAVQRLYEKGYDALFPVRDFRCVQLFESIVIHCANVILWKDIAGEPFPDIEIRPYSGRPVLRSVVTPLLADETRPLHVDIELPDEIAHCLRPVQTPGGDLEYLLVSDTATRALHVFFVHPELARRLFHVAFFHDDVSGSLATILGLLRDADFNILTSLSRKRSQGRSVWEAVLEYQGTDEPPLGGTRPAHAPLTQGELDWIGDRIVTAHRNASWEPTDCRVRVSRPLYPGTFKRRRPRAVTAYPLSDRLRRPGRRAHPQQSDTLDDLLAKRRAESVERQPSAVEGRTNQLLKLIEKRRAEAGRSAVFLSYPHTAVRHGAALAQRLRELFRVVTYQKPDGEEIADEIRRRIEDSDYFIAIWHHDGDSLSSGERTRAVSPFLLFEYGVAQRVRKQAIVVHSEHLDPQVWSWVRPTVANPEYSDDAFDPDTINTIMDYCERHFV